MEDGYLNIVNRLEPDIHPIDSAGGWASVAISLKRIADELAQIRTLLSDVISEARDANKS